MSLKTTILYKKLQKRYSRRINLDLSRIKKVLNVLGNPHLKMSNPCNVIGSDGKMSVLTSLKYFLISEKKRVTAFTSPHLCDVRERFWLKDRHINFKEMNKFVKIVEKTKLKLTLFELLTCVYILAASKKNEVSFNLIESGLFFKKDSTNLWKFPRAQIITNINFQHQDWIYPKTINEICKQKVGYLSKNTTIYISKQDRKVLKIIKKILKKNPSKKVFPSIWKIQHKNKKIYYKDKKNSIPILNKNIKSKGLLNNLGLAIKIALDFGVSKNTIKKTIPKIKFDGRVQYVKNGKLKKILYKKEKLLIDGCHSKKSAENLFNYLKTIDGPIYGIWGMQKNKLPEIFLKSFNNIFKKIVTMKIPDEPNALSAVKLKEICRKQNYIAETSPNFSSALKQCSDKKRKTIVVFGSLYLIGKFLNAN